MAIEIEWIPVPNIELRAVPDIADGEYLFFFETGLMKNGEIINGLIYLYGNKEDGVRILYYSKDSSKDVDPTDGKCIPTKKGSQLWLTKS